MTRTPRKSLVNIQVLRGFAAISVVGKHAADQFPNIKALPRIDATQVGVDIFFVISGFIMVYVTATRPQTSSGFLLNRIVRIAPNYWFYTLLTALLAVAAPSVFRGTSFGVWHLILSLLFIAHVNPATYSTSPLLRLGWTLNYEMFFYVIFSISMLVPTVSVVRRVSIAAGLIIASVLIGLILQPTNAIALFYTRDIMLEFVYGMLLAAAYFGNLTNLPRWIIPPLLMVAGLCIFATSNMVSASMGPRSVYFGLPALLIVFCGLVLERTETRAVMPLLQKLGDASFTIYLCHPFSTSLFRAILHSGHVTPQNLPQNMAFIVFNVAFAAFMGYWAYKFIETPLVSISRRALRYTSAF